MPISINFLAEQQAQEELRRKDPVKRGYLVGAIVVGVMLSLYLFLQLKLWSAHSEVSIYDNKFKSIESRYRQAQTNKVQLDDAQLRLAAVEAFSRERTLWANALNSLQFAALENVPLMEFRMQQQWSLSAAVPMKTNANGTMASPAKPARSREISSLVLAAKDYGSRSSGGGEPGNQIDTYQSRLQNQPYFKTNVSAIRMKGRSQAQDEPGTKKRFVDFELECLFPEKER